MAPTQKKPIDTVALRKKLMTDATTKGIAKNLGVDLKEYVDQVIYFVENPKAEPELYVMKDEDLRAAGFEVAGPDEILEVIQNAAATTRRETSEFSDLRKKLVDLDGK
jgi:hypothetical protein